MKLRGVYCYCWIENKMRKRGNVLHVHFVIMKFHHLDFRYSRINNPHSQETIIHTDIAISSRVVGIAVTDITFYFTGALSVFAWVWFASIVTTS